MADKRISIPFSGLGKCRRQIAYKILKIPISDPTPYEARVRMNKGTASEDRVVPDLERRGYRITHATQGQKTMTIVLPGDQMQFRGRSDGFLKDVKWFVLELKLVGTKQWRRWKRNGVALFRPNYMAQAHAEMASSGIWDTWFEATDRDKLDKDELVGHTEKIEFDLGYWGEIVDRWKEILPYLLQRKLPPPDYSGKTWECAPGSCNWSSVCPSGKFYQSRQELTIEEVTHHDTT